MTECVYNRDMSNTATTATKPANEIRIGDSISPYALTDGTPLGWETVTNITATDSGMVTNLWVHMGPTFRKCYRNDDLIVVA